MKKLFAIYLHSMMRLAEYSPLIRRLLRSGNSILVRYLVHRYRKEGLSGWRRFWIPAFYEYGRYRSEYLIRKMNINVRDPQSIGRYHDYEDPILGVEGHWERDETGAPVRVETSCVVCDDLKRMTDNPACQADFCRHIVNAMETGTGRSINEKYRVEIIALLTEGDESCRFVHRLDTECGDASADQNQQKIA